MSSTDQAFIQAFARRKRGSANEPATRERNTVSTNTEAELSPLRVWVDPLGKHIRTDEADPSAPRPHVDPARVSSPVVEGSVDPIRHTHTAYASTFSNVAAEIAAAQRQAPQAQAAQTTAPVAPQKQVADDSVFRFADVGGGVVNRADPGHALTPAPTNPRNVDEPKQNSAENRSAKTAPAHVQPHFQAAWEVDAFEIPTNVVELFFEPKLFQQIAERIASVVSSGLGSVLVTSTKPGEGRSSVAIGLAMAAAATGIRVALIDADAEHPTLADDLRLDLQYGWVDAIRGGSPIGEIAVHAVDDGVTLIPLMPPQGQGTATAYEVVRLIDSIKDKFQLVIVDGPSGASMNLHQCAAVVDSAIIVRDVNGTDSLSLNEFAQRLGASGVRGIGVVENFA